jgi:hypothetical protein
MKRGNLIQMTEEELERDRRKMAKAGAEAVMDSLRAAERRLQMLNGFADKATLAEAYETSVSTIERWDKRHGFKRVDGPRRDRVYFDLTDVRAKVTAEDQSESEREASSGPDDSKPRR